MEVESVSGRSDVDESNVDVINPIYATQFFGFTPYSVFDEIFNIILDYVKDAVNTVHKYLSVKLPYIPKDKLQQGSENITKVVVDVLEKNINKLEVYQLKNVFHVPDHLVLPEDEVHQDKVIVATKEKELDNEIDELRTKISGAIDRIAKLRNRKNDLEVVTKRFRQTVKTFTEMDECLEAAGVTDFSKSIAEAKQSTRELTFIQNHES